MAIVLDTSVLLAAVDLDEDHHEEVRDWLDSVSDALVTTPLALAEIDYLVHQKLGRAAADAVWSDFETGAYLVRWWRTALTEAVAVARRWASLRIGLVDASLVALAARLGTERVATLDQRHFRRLTTGHGRHFTILPADAS